VELARPHHIRVFQSRDPRHQIFDVGDQVLISVDAAALMSVTP